MSYVKISGLPASSNLNSNPAQSIFPTVDLTLGQTTKISAQALGNSLYSNNTLIVGTGGVLLPNTVAQFTGLSGKYAQVSAQNLNAAGSIDYISTADVGTDTSYYLDMGLNNSTFNDSTFTVAKALDGYLYVQGGLAGQTANLAIGVATANSNVNFFAGGTLSQNIIMSINSSGVSITKSLNVSSNGITFSDGTTLYSNTSIQSAYNQANLANSIANTAVQNTATIQLQTLRLSGNLIANTPGQSISVDRITSNTATFNQNLVVLGNLTANTLLGNVFFSNVVTTTSQSNSILWTTQAGAIAQQTAQLWYYSNTQSLILDTDIPGDRLSISKVLFFRAFNSTGATIPINSFVRLVPGVTANQIPYIALADATNSANATVAGFVKNAIANSAYGFAYSQGIVEDFNTTSFGANGDILFLSTTPGQSSNVAPLSGNSNTVVQLGKVILSDATQGKLFIKNELREAYGRTNGSLLYAFANNITASNTVSINDSTQTLTSNNIIANTITVSGNISANTIIANTFVYGSATANGMVTQLTSKSTAVTSNGITGQITTNNAALAGQAYVTFTVNNSYVKHSNDIIILNVQNSVTTPNPYLVGVGNVSVGSFNVTVYNVDSGGGSSHSDAIVLNYAVMRVGN